MKRFLNHLRFAAAGRGSALSGGVLVGLGVTALADLEVVRALAEHGNDLLAQIQDRVKSGPVWNAIAEAGDGERLLRSGLPAFNPTREEAGRFLELWEGVRVRV